MHHRSAHYALNAALVLLVLVASLAVGVARASAFGFAPRVDYAAGSQTSQVVVADFNGDSKLDLAVANETSGSVSVLLGNGDGTYGAKTDFTAGANAFAIVAGDFNGDLKVDVAVGNFNGSSVSVLLGNGDGTFAVKVDYAVGLNPMSVTVGDFNGDGKQDLSAANRGSNTVSVLLGNGDGTFAAKVDYPTGSFAWTVAVGDFNGDSKQDLAVTNTFSTSVSILLGNGDGTFAARTDFGTGSGPTGMTVGDLNNDGAQDLAIGNNSGTSVSILLGIGDGSFAAKVDYAIGVNSYQVAAGDVDGDGVLDLAATNHASGNVSVLTGNGNGTFAAKVDFATGSEPYGVVIEDLNGDGRPDLGVASRGFNNIGILLNTTPTAETAINGGAAATRDRIVTVDSSSALNVTEMRLCNAGGGWTAWQSYMAHVDWTLPAGDGLKSVQIQYRNVTDTSVITAHAIILDRVAPTTTDDAPAGWQTGSPVTLNLTPVDSGPGISGMVGGEAKTQYKLDDDVSWSTSTSFGVFGDGIHTVKYRSVDAVGNVEETQSCTVRIDATAPVVAIWGADALWHRGAVSVFITAGDGIDGSAVAALGCTIDGVWQDGPFFVISGDGDHTLIPGATDVAGNPAAGVPTTHVKIDTTGPVTSGLAASVRKGKKATLKIKATDALSPTVSFSVKIKNSAGKIVKTLTVPGQAANVTVPVSFTCKLAKGTYKYVVYATDEAGNKQVKAGGNKLVVK